jgi:hypothetical protein
MIEWLGAVAKGEKDASCERAEYPGKACRQHLLHHQRDHLYVGRLILSLMRHVSKQMVVIVNEVDMRRRGRPYNRAFKATLNRGGGRRFIRGR